MTETMTEERLTDRNVGSIGDLYKLLSLTIKNTDAKILNLRVMTSEDEWMFPRELCHEIILRLSEATYDIRVIWYVFRGFVTKASHYKH
jgi:hypothetical protein